MKLNDIVYEKRDGIAIATFNRPDVLNAFRQATLREFITILDDVNADETVRILVITGKGRAFSAGIDLKEMAHTIATNAPISVRLVKQTMQRTYDLDLEAVMQLEVDGMLQCFRSEDLVEGFNAFLEKRTPVYKGK